MRKFQMLIISFSTIFLSYSASASDLPTVMDYAQTNDMNDKYHQSSLMARCAGVLGAYARYLPKKTMAAEKEAIFNKAMTFMALSVTTLAAKGQISEEQALQQIQRDFDVYNELYYRQITFEQTKSGSIMGGSIGQEFETCMQVTK